MALINDSSTTKNLVVTEGLSVTYSKAMTKGTWSWGTSTLSGTYNQMHELHRYATKAFKFVGYTYEAAKAKRDSLVTELTRDFSQSVWNGAVLNGEWDTYAAGTMLMSDVSLTYDAGDAWCVNVRVHEDDMRMIKVGEDPAFTTRFAAENARTYGTGGIGD